jgi:hypothetical protein
MVLHNFSNSFFSSSGGEFFADHQKFANHQKQILSRCFNFITSFFHLNAENRAGQDCLTKKFY